MLSRGRIRNNRANSMYIYVKKKLSYTISVSKFLVERLFESHKVRIIKNIR